MSTHARIGIEKYSGEIVSVYLHCDGAVKHAGKILTENYGKEDFAFDLVSRGDISRLGVTVEECSFYKDRGEPWYDVAPILSKTIRAFVENQGEEYNYLFKDKNWYLVTNDYSLLELGIPVRS